MQAASKRSERGGYGLDRRGSKGEADIAVYSRASKTFNIINTTLLREACAIRFMVVLHVASQELDKHCVQAQRFTVASILSGPRVCRSSHGMPDVSVLLLLRLPRMQ